MEGWTLLGQPGSEGAGPLRLVQMCVAANADRRLEVFAIDANGLAHHIWEVAPDTWSSWAVLDGAGSGERDFDTSSEPMVARQRDGRLQVFMRTKTSQDLRTIYQKSVGTNWSGWGNIWGVPGLLLASGDLSVNATFPAVAANEDGRLEIFAWVNTTDGWVPYHRWQTSPSGGWTGSIEPLRVPYLGAPPTSGPGSFAVGGYADGRIQVFTVSGDRIWQTAQSKPNNGWVGWFSTDQINFHGAPALGRNQDGRLEVFATGDDGAIWHQWQEGLPNSEVWSPWVSMGGLFFSSPLVSIDPEERLNVFAVQQDKTTIVMNRQTTPNGGWGSWTPIGKAKAITALIPYPTMRTAIYGGEDNSFPRLRLFALDDGVLWFRSIELG